MKVNYSILNNSVVVNFSGKTISIAKGDARFNGVIRAIKDDKLEDIPELVAYETIISGEGIELRNGTVYIDNVAMPDSLSDRVLDFKREGIPYAHLVTFFKKLQKNPSFNSRSMLFKFLEHNGHPLTQDGNFIAYRGVTKDFKDLHTRTFDNSVGSICKMPRSEVDDNPENTCSHGLHVACFNYAHGFGSTTVEVEVNPEDVVCVPKDYNGTKMRVCKFKVVSVSKGSERDEVLYGKEKKYSSNQSEDFENNSWELEVSDSSIIEFIKYDAINEELIVDLTNGKSYCYYAVDIDTAESFRSEPTGNFYNTYICREYNFNEI